MHLLVNAYWEPLDFELPPLGQASEGPWMRWIDTALESPNDIVYWQMETPVAGDVYRVETRSVAVLVARLKTGAHPVLQPG